MMEKLLELLQRVDKEENLFGKEVMDNIQYGECKDVYVIRTFGGPDDLVISKKDSFESLLVQLVHYLTRKRNHYKNNFSKDELSPYTKDWLTFKEEYNVVVTMFYYLDILSDYEKIFDFLISVLGKVNYRAVHDARVIKKSNVLELAESVFRYLGATRAVRNLSIKYLDETFGIQWEFHLWHMTPHDLTENYGYIFYLGNEMDSLEWCPLSYAAKEYYYNSFYKKLYENLFIDLPVYKQISDEEKEMAGKEVWRITHSTDEDDSFEHEDEEIEELLEEEWDDLELEEE